MEIENKEQADLELTKRTNRRRMAWSSLISMFVVMGAVFLVSPEKAKALQEIITLYFIANASIVAGYFGFSAWMSR